MTNLDPIEFTPAESFLLDMAIPCDDCADALCDGFCTDTDVILYDSAN